MIALAARPHRSRCTAAGACPVGVGPTGTTGDGVRGATCWRGPDAAHCRLCSAGPRTLSDAATAGGAVDGGSADLAGREPAVRRHQGAAGGRVRRRAGPDLRARRPQRRGQDLAVQLHQRALQADRRHVRDRRHRGAAARVRRRSPVTAWPARSSIRRCSCTRRCSRTCCSARTPDCPAERWSGRCGCRAPGASEKELRAEALDLLERNGLGWAAHLPADELSHGLHKGVELCRALLMKPQAAAARRARRRPPARRGGDADRDGPAPARRATTSPSSSSSTTWASSPPSPTASSCSTTARKLMEGTAAEAQSDPRVIEAYIGKDAADDAA